MFPACSRPLDARELEIYVRLEMSPMEAIQTATKNAAEALWLGKELGTIKDGKFADILAIDSDPSKDITVPCDKENLKMVMKEGEGVTELSKAVLGGLHHEYLLVPSGA